MAVYMHVSIFVCCKCVLYALADPDTPLGGHINADIRYGSQFNMHPSISRIFLRWRGSKSMAKLDLLLWTDLLPQIRHWL